MHSRPLLWKKLFIHFDNLVSLELYEEVDTIATCVTVLYNTSSDFKQCGINNKNFSDQTTHCTSTV